MFEMISIGNHEVKAVFASVQHSRCINQQGSYICSVQLSKQYELIAYCTFWWDFVWIGWLLCQSVKKQGNPEVGQHIQQ